MKRGFSNNYGLRGLNGKARLAQALAQESMNRSAIIGVIGGSGSTGKAVAKELRRSTESAILIGGRNLANLEAVAANLGVAVSAVRVDVRDPRSLEEFCGRCSIVVNCGGPVSELQDAVAQAALRTRSHYVDVAGLTLVREGMTPHDQELSHLGLACVVSAGWLPGMTELLPAYSLAVSKTRMEVIHSVTSYSGDSGGWSNSAMQRRLVRHSRAPRRARLPSPPR